MALWEHCSPLLKPPQWLAITLRVKRKALVLRDTSND